MYIVRFNAAFAATAAEDFISGFLVNKLGARFLVTGEDFRFGAQRRGDSAMLAAAATQQGFVYYAAPAVCEGEEVISSSSIRKALAAGEVGHAARLLGRSFALEGRVIHGQKRGRVLGFPTANIALARLFVPRLGVYAVRVKDMASGEGWHGVANIGLRPTFGGTCAQAEVHLFDFAGDLYGKKMQVELKAFLREEKKFNTVEALKVQITEDCRKALDYD
jgi:riboflavin kinase / FMN adenylyltransferase